MYKYELYGQYGVREYWVVSPKEKLVHRHVNTGHSLALASTYSVGVAKSEIISGLKIDIDEVMEVASVHDDDTLE